MNYTDVARRYEDELTGSIIPFWERYSPDKRHGGYFTCLDRDGTVYDTTKYLWMQWRIVYMFAFFAKTDFGSSSWVDLALDGYEFLTSHGKAEDGNYYFALAQNGTPAIAPYNIYTEYFASLAAAAVFEVTGEHVHREEALASAERYMGRLDDPKGRWEKKLPGWQRRETLGHFMMLLNLWDGLECHLGIQEYRAKTQPLLTKILDTFWNPDFGIAFENVNLDGSFDLDSQEGRHLNPGHVLEALWFIMDVAKKHELPEIARQAAGMVIPTLEFSWDTEYGGIRYFMDVLGKPHIELQADMKLWWVHCEAIMALVYARTILESDDIDHWLDTVDHWTWERFPDSKHGEWFGYLHRSGDMSHTLKGGKWKTFFHLPRYLYMASKAIREHSSE